MSDILEQEHTTNGKYPTKYLLYPCDGAKYLMVIFSAFAPSNSPLQHPYHHIKILEGMPVHRLYIQDAFGRSGVYYLCHHTDFGVADEVEALIRNVQASLGCDDAHTIPFGSSKGGSAALYFGLRMHLAHVLSAVPQFRIGTYLQNGNQYNHQTLQDIIGDQDREERIKKLDMVIERLLLENRDSTLHVLTSTGDEQYPEQIVPLLDVLDREQIRNRHDICFQERMKSHNDVANRLKDFINIRLLQILYGCEVRTEQNIQTVSRDNRDSESYQVIYRYEKRDGTVEQHVLDNGCCSVPVDQIWYSEILVLKDGQEIWSFSLSEWLEDTVSVSFQQAETGWDIDFMPNDTCPPNMTFNFQIHDQKGTRLYTQSYSRETHYHVDLQLDKGYYHYILRYKKYAFVSPKLAYQKTDC